MLVGGLGMGPISIGPGMGPLLLNEGLIPRSVLL